MGSSRSRNSTRAGKARSAKRTKSSRRRATGRSPGPTKPRIPATIEIAIDEQRDSVGTAISLLYCLHSTLRHESVPDAGPSESEGVDGAAKWVDLTDITAMLLVRLNTIHLALDSVELVRAKIDPEMVQLTEIARELVSSDGREAS